MSDYARDVYVDTEAGEFSIGGQPFPWFFSAVEPTIVEGANGEAVAGVRVSIACSDVTVVSPSKMLDEQLGEEVTGG